MRAPDCKSVPDSACVALPQPPALTGREALFLDFDGTLTPIASTPDAVRVDAALPPLLERLSCRLGGALALLTGRPLAQVDDLLGMRLPGAGVHGLEFRASSEGPINYLGPQWPLKPVENALAPVLEADTRLLLETKPGSVALHYRAAPERAEELAAVALDVVGRHRDLTLLHGDCVLEIKPVGFDKGRAMAMFLGLEPWSGRLPVAVGDDVTDEDAFRKAAAIGGYGIKIGRAATQARYRLATTISLAAWLRL
ncbi:trehalose-phosphatase [Iodidimonas sp. SYSU 1G8]|uniref:trehalose-phosphatase n=1 Tax=Iodidimonas sp. SYSU 1G8 TaxID=3133967 RepID=UPI0031FECAD8